MKKRIKIDASILAIVILSSGGIFFFKNLYPQERWIDNVFDFLGIIMILKGTFLRMLARGHKAANSKKSEQLVTSGIYKVVRNPMYLGSFMIGAGFALTLWPWWFIFIFAGIFYMRFNQEMVKEEQLLSKVFGQKYKDYMKATPRLFPVVKNIFKMDVREIMNFNEAYSTKESRGLLVWTLLAFVLETVQEMLVYGYTDFGETAIIILWGAFLFFVSRIMFYSEMR